jgi:geranylgeranyl diphosphate synthase type I
MDFTQTLVALRAEINQAMQQYIDEQKVHLAKDEVFLREAIEQVEKVVMSGGKRVRGILLIEGYLAAGGQDRAVVLRAAAGIEFLHAYLLIHDDIMDRDVLRHGQPTLHSVYQKFAKTSFVTDDSVHFGNSIALVLGDMVCAWGNDLVFSVDLPRENVQRAIRFLQQVVFATGAGQMEDMRIQYQAKATKDEVLALYQKKTAQYTIVGPLTMGALLAGEAAKLEAFFAEFGNALGIAFQITDDLLGLSSSEAATGKTLAADITEGKMTYPMVVLLESLSATDAKKVRAILQKQSHVTDEEVRFILRALPPPSAGRHFRQSAAR